MGITDALKNKKVVTNFSNKEADATINVASGLARAIGQGISFGFADEAEAYIRSKFSDRDYKQIRDEIRGKVDKFRDENAGLAYGAEIAASVATAFIPGGALAQAARVPQTAIKAGSVLAGGPLRRAMQSGGLYGAGVAEEVKDIPLSASTGALIGGTVQKLTPAVTEGAKSLIKKGASLSPGEKYGGIIGTIEAGLENAPIAKGLMGRAGGLTEKSVAPVMYGEVMSTLGKKLPIGLSPRGAYRAVRTEFKKQYDDALEGATISVDQNFKDSIDEVLNKYSSGFDELAPSDMKKLNSFIQSKIIGGAENGTLTASKFKSIQSQIKQQTRKLLAKSETTIEQDNLVSALTGIDNALMNSLAASNPAKSAQIKKINKAYSMFKPLERASIKAGTAQKSGFTPTQVDTEIKRQSSAGAYIGGKAPMQKTVEEFMDIEPKVSMGLPTIGLGGAAASGVTAPGAGTVGLSTAGTALYPLAVPLGAAILGSTKTGRTAITPRLPSKMPIVGGKAIPGVIDVPSMALRAPATSGLLSQEPGPQRFTAGLGEKAAGIPDYVRGLLQ